MTRVTVVGIDGRALPELARARLDNARLVVGAPRHLDSVALPAGAKRLRLEKVGEAIAAIGQQDGAVVVLASGDPGFFGILRALRESGVGELEVVPGVSSVASAFALAGMSWDDAVVVSAHGRDLARAANVCRALPKVAVLTGPGAGPRQLGAALQGWSRRLTVVEAIGTARQQLTECSPAQAAQRDWSDPNVVLVCRSGESRMGWLAPPRQSPPRWGLAEEAFRHRDGMITKAEVRAVALAHLGPGVGELVWDVGCGSGSVAVECARFGAAVIAVDRDPAQCERVADNAAAHQVDVAVLAGEAPGCLDELPAPDSVFVGGGGAQTVCAVVRRQPRALVVALTALDRVGSARDALRGGGYEVGGVELSASRLVDLPDRASRLAAMNPVFLLWGHR